MTKSLNRKQPFYIAGVLLGVLLLLLVGYLIGYDRIERKLRSVVVSSIMLDRTKGEEEFPVVHGNLSDTQRKIVVLTKQEFAAQSPGVKFNEGQEEAWCANFVSWIMKEAGVPLKNPNSGSWRIPGTYTLRDYFVAEGRFQPSGTGYKPVVGDVAIYQNSPIFGEHANIVIKSENGMLTTVGGNENNRIRVYKNEKREYTGLVGYGVLASH